VFTNIKAGNTGRIFNAAGEGWEAGLRSLLPVAVIKQAAQKAESKFVDWLFDFAVSGTAEEVIPENIIQVGLNLIPLSAIMPQAWAMQIQEIIQEIATPNGKMHSLSVTDMQRILRKGGTIAAVNFRIGRGIVSEEAKRLSEKLAGKTWKDLEANGAELLRQLGAYLNAGDEIIVNENGYLRTITVEKGSEWTHYFDVRVKMAEFTPLDTETLSQKTVK
jgi:hypothetical protein